MSFLLPLGLLGLLSIIALILIYIIKPNFQQKFVSSTYIWRLSLKYRRKNIPINRFRNILLFICQLLILTACALLLAWPVIQEERRDTVENIAIIDASASMRVSNNDTSRFERAVEKAIDLARTTAEGGGLFSAILADGDAHYIVQRAAAENVSDTVAALSELVEGDGKCTFGSADFDGAVELAEAVVVQNPDTDVTLFTATTYIDKGGIEVVNVAEKDEWNAAILSAVAEVKDNYYSFDVRVGCYGRSERLTVHCDVMGVNNETGEYGTIHMSRTEMFDNVDREFDISFGIEEQLDAGRAAVYSFSSVHVYIEADDTFRDDNSFYIYGGNKPVIKIQYVSNDPCIFFQNTLYVLRGFVTDDWEVELTTVTERDKIATEGYDFYLFETLMPRVMPIDGLVMIFNPGEGTIEGLGAEFSRVHNVNRDSTLAMGTPHPITEKLDATEITVSAYREIRLAEGFIELMYYEGAPVVAVREEKDFTYIVYSFSIHESSLAAVLEFPLSFYTVFNRYIPVTVPSRSYVVGSTVPVNARGNSLAVSGPELEKTVEEFPSTIDVGLPGSYTLTQAVRDEILQDNFYVYVSPFESNITKEVDALPLLERNKKTEYADRDLLVWFAAALLALLFVEWFLQSREYMR